MADEKFSYPFPLRFVDEDSYEAMLKLADKNKRSLNSEINIAMDEYVKRHRKEIEEETK